MTNNANKYIEHIHPLRLTFECEPDIEYSAHPKVLIGAWTKYVPIVMRSNSNMSQPACVAHQEKFNYQKLRYHQNY